ncbi:MAG TPA: phosphatase PAP2 family protein [Thermomicrobiaceae bacterium]|nr:phosphatase PAP2 family protein [Thermomicrobiaceae bacterium]
MDGSLYTAINGLAGHIDAVDDFMAFISSYGQYLMLLVLVLLWFWPRLDRSRRQWSVITAAVAALLALATDQVISHLWERPRPFIAHAHLLLLAPSTDPSFPSDHAAGAFAIAVALVLFWRRIGWLMVFFAALIAFSRVYTGEHYVSDVLAGALIGTLAALIVYFARPLLAPLLEPPLRLARRCHLA